MGAMKKSFRFSGNTQVLTNRCDYYGFSVLTGGVDVPFQAYDGTSPGGRMIENYLCYGTFPTDGHDHVDPIACVSGLYVQCAVSGIVWAWNDPLQG